MCHKINILQLDDEEIEIRTSDTLKLRELEPNSIESDSKDVLSSKSNRCIGFEKKSKPF